MTLPFAPGLTSMRFSAVSSSTCIASVTHDSRPETGELTMMTATPVPMSSLITTPSTLTPSRCSVAFSAPPNPSAPTAPTIRTVISEWAPAESRDKRQAATAWFAPFPPGAVENDFDVSVSPGCGKRLVTVTRSVFSEPTTVIVLGGISGLISVRMWTSRRVCRWAGTKDQQP